MTEVMDYVINRLAEASTWKGFIWILVSLGLIPAGSADLTLSYVVDLIQGASALVGLISILAPDKNCLLTNWIRRRIARRDALTE